MPFYEHNHQTEIIFISEIDHSGHCTEIYFNSFIIINMQHVLTFNDPPFPICTNHAMY